MRRVSQRDAVSGPFGCSSQNSKPEGSTVLLLLVRQSQIDGRCGLRIVSGDAVARAWGSEARKYVARDIAETLTGGFDLIDGQAGHQMVQLLLFAGVGVFFGHCV